MSPRLRHIDWILFGAIVPLVLAGLVTMHSFTGENYFFTRQILWVLTATAVMFSASFVDWRFLRQSKVLVVLYGIMLFLLALLFLGSAIKGARSWFLLPGFSLQPADFVKLLLVVMLAKYFSRRHVEIANVKHIIISGMYAFIPFVLIFFQPDFGSAIILFCIWLGMVMVSGISKKHLILVAASGAVALSLLWFFVFDTYQKERILTFIDPLRDIRGAGYNAFQSQVAVGSGRVMGKGVGFGTQSRLAFLPEYETDFIFAAFAEEWGFVGVSLLYLLFLVVVVRIAQSAYHGATNFETLFGLGLAIYFMSHMFINIGMNIGILPVTGITLPFLSYGGSHLLAEFLGIGMLMGMRKYSRAIHRDDIRELGIESSKGVL